MPRPLRDCRPGSLLHVINHGQAHAPVFEAAGDVDQLLQLLGWAVREGWIRVLAYTVLATHFHLILETCDGKLDAAMRRIQSAFATWRNRTRERRGHVFRARYFAREIFGTIDLAGTLDYVDQNAVAAGIVGRPDAYPYASARAYIAGGGVGWLSRERVEAVICRIARTARYASTSYPLLWRWAGRSGLREVLARGGVPALADVPVLATAGPDFVQAWLREHLLREEGRASPLVVVPGAQLLRQRSALLSGDRDTQLAGLLHGVAGLTVREIAEQLAMSSAAIGRRVAKHRQQMLADGCYAADCARVVEAGLREGFGPLVSGDANVA